METNKEVGRPVDRYDGVAKVTGEAKYAAEHFADDLLYGVVSSSEIAKGRITNISTEKALKVKGVVEVLTYKNRSDLAWFNRKYNDDDAPPGWHFRALYDDKVRYSGQPVALVVAEDFETARFAASLIEVEYEVEKHETDLEKVLDAAYVPKKNKPGFEKPTSRGDAKKAFAEAPVRIEADYLHPMEHHNPMEMHASTVLRHDDGSYTIADKTQGTANSQNYICKVFGLKEDKVRVIAPYIGGAFGSGLRPQYQLLLAMMASVKLERSVRVVLTRQQMFSFGHRPAAVQKVKLSSNEEGQLESIDHSVCAETSQFEDYSENTVNWSGILYKCENVSQEHKLAKLDTYTPLDMRAPGAVTGMFALESAMDELSYAAGCDPLELRLKNYVDKDQVYYGRPFSSKELRAAYELGAEKFGWKKRSREPRSMKEGHKLIGWGVASGIWDAQLSKTAATAELKRDGSLEVSSAVTDIGTGTYTIMTQLAADALGVPLKKISATIGDSKLAAAPLQGGSWTAASVGTAVHNACLAVGEKLFKLAKDLPDSPFASSKFDDVEFSDGSLRIKGEPGRSMKFERILELSKTDSIKEEGAAAPSPLKQMPYARNTHSAVFAEVKVDEDFGTVEATRIVAAIAAGRILNPKTARSQILGGVVFGISQALHEVSLTDHKLGRIMNHNFADYHIPVNKDVRDIDVIFVPEKDDVVSPIGVKGLGEIGGVGTAAAIANAVFHATGKRVRQLPITLDRIFEN
jgi:xanthine dehydrogenase YagR molybdenum-binding subunit